MKTAGKKGRKERKKKKENWLSECRGVGVYEHSLQKRKRKRKRKRRRALILSCLVSYIIKRCSRPYYLCYILNKSHSYLYAFPTRPGGPVPRESFLASFSPFFSFPSPLWRQIITKSHLKKKKLFTVVNCRLSLWSLLFLTCTERAILPPPFPL